MTCCPECSVKIREALINSVSQVAVENAKGAELDWASDLAEDSREHMREVARNSLNHVARKLGIPLL